MQPIILAHGFLSYKHFLVWEIFKGVQKAYQQKGIAAVQPVVHPTASIADRARQLHEAIDESVGPDEPIHIVAHSMGGLDARYYLSPNGRNQGHRVLSLTTISTPHHGACLAEVIKKPYCHMLSWGAWLGHFLVLPMESRRFLEQVGDKTWDAIEQLTPQYVQNEFNPLIIDHPRVRYFSYAGVRHRTNSFLTEVTRGRPQHYICPREGDNDGMVSVESAKWGEFKGVLNGDHGELVGLQVYPWKKSSFDHISFFLQLTEDLERVEEEQQSTVLHS